jgi:hypothetical protein
MRHAIAVCLLALTGCVAESSSSETLAPLPTMDVDQTAPNTVQILSPEVVSQLTTTIAPDEYAISAYLGFARDRNVSKEKFSDDDIIGWSETWCDFMIRGMGKINLLDWINEMAGDGDELYAWVVTAEASAYFICPDQAYRWNP